MQLSRVMLSAWLSAVPLMLVGSRVAAQSTAFEPDRIFIGVGGYRHDTHLAARRDILATASYGLVVLQDGSWLTCRGNSYPYGESELPPVPWSQIREFGEYAALLTDGSVVRWGGWLWGGQLPAGVVYTDIASSVDRVYAVREDGVIAYAGLGTFVSPPLPPGVRYTHVAGDLSAARSDGKVVALASGVTLAERSLPVGVSVMQLTRGASLGSDGVVRSNPFWIPNSHEDSFELLPPDGDPFIKIGGSRGTLALTASGRIFMGGQRGMHLPEDGASSPRIRDISSVADSLVRQDGSVEDFVPEADRVQYLTGGVERTPSGLPYHRAVHTGSESFLIAMDGSVSRGGRIEATVSDPESVIQFGNVPGISEFCVLRADGTLRGVTSGVSAAPAGWPAIRAMGSGYALCFDGRIRVFPGINAPPQFPEPPMGVQYVSIAFESPYASALRSDGQVVCMPADRPQPPVLEGAERFIEIAARHGVTNFGRVLSWASGALPPVPPAGLLFTAVRANGYAVFGRLSDGSWISWGMGFYMSRVVRPPPVGYQLTDMRVGGSNYFLAVYDRVIQNSDSDGDDWPNALDNCPERFNPTQRDCDGDGLGDACELENGMASDYNGNGLPDNCECIADITGNSSVDGIDLALVLGLWGTTGQDGGFDADIDNDGIVSGIDLSLVLSSWGACP